ncbi:protein SPO16 homolog [Hyperolius riggenbachi]|uniref:protein SPO16 homolog n=1 Tax=Hyperolius riggenbachi TaxID=752182 RepID=UPI0035A28FCC
MAAQSVQETDCWSTTVILSNTLKDHEIATALQSQQHKIRFSETVLSASVIFPLSGIAFLLVNSQELFNTPRETLDDKIKRFISVHRNSFLAIVADFHGPEEWHLMFNIQLRFLGSNLQIIPAHNGADVVKSMLTVAKATCKPHIENIQERLCQAKMRITENSPVWKTLEQI